MVHEVHPEQISEKCMILVLSGLPASGKSTFAKKWVSEAPEKRVRINYDDLRLSMFGPHWVWNHKDEEKMKAEALARATEAIKLGYSVVVDNTNLSARAQAPWVQLAATHGVGLEFLDFDTPLHTCIERDKTRAERVGRAVIDRFALFGGRIKWDTTRDYVIVDVDGTLSDPTHRLHFVKSKIEHHSECPNLAPIKDNKCTYCGATRPKANWPKFFAEAKNDPPKKPIVDLVGCLADACYEIIIVSGRPIDRCGIITEEWLDALDSSASTYSHLFMRNGGDFRPDDVVKEEILSFLPKQRIAFVLDDRDRVVEMWRRNGLTCLQVNKGDF
jgi:predicted kinase